MDEAPRRAWLEPLSAGAAAMWGCALGLDTVLVAALVYSRTREPLLAVALAASTLAASLAALLVALSAVERARRRR